MKRKRFTEEQIIGILNEAEQAGNIREVCRLNNITEQTFYRWRTKFGGMDVSEAKRLKKRAQIADRMLSKATALGDVSIQLSFAQYAKGSRTNSNPRP